MYDDLVTIGQVIKPFGVHGDVRVRSLTDVPGRFERLRTVTLEAPSGTVVQTAITRIRPDRDSYVIGFEAFSAPEQIAAFRGALVKAPRDPSSDLPEGQYLHCDLIGMSVATESGEELGTLRDVLETPSNAVFVVVGPRGEVLLPATKEVVAEVDVRGQRMIVRHLDGLLEASGQHGHAL